MTRIIEEIRNGDVYFTIIHPSYTEEYINESIFPRLEQVSNMIDESEVTRCKELLSLVRSLENNKKV